MNDFKRFWDKVLVGDECWEWQAALRQGYGSFAMAHHSCYAHRIAYEMLVGPIPKGLDIDHLCRNRRCVNPAHLEPVTRRTNLLRSPLMVFAVGALMTECKKGHAYTVENTRVRRDGTRVCRICYHGYDRTRRERDKVRK